MSTYQGVAHNSRWVPKIRTVVVEKVGVGSTMCPACQERRTCVILGMNGVAVARHGLILNQDGATSFRKVSRYLPGLRDAIQNSKMAAKVQTKHKQIQCVVFFPYICILPIHRPGS